MTEEDRKRFGLAMEALAAIYRQEATVALIHGYWIGMRDIPIRDFEEAVTRALRECRHMPTVAELRELAGVVPAADRAIIAWTVFEQAVRDHGGYASVDFEDRAINATVRNLGGWERICELSPEEFDKWLRKDFLATYPATRNLADGPAGAALGGIHERENNALGFEPTRPVILIKSTPTPRLSGPKEAVE